MLFTRNLKSYLPTLALGLVASIGLALNQGDTLIARVGPFSPSGIPTIKVESGIVEHTIRLTGVTVAQNSVLMRAPYLRGRRSGARSGAFGLVLQDLAASGSRVRKNDPVAKFDSLAMLNRLDDYRAARVEDELSLRTMRADRRVKRVAYQQQIRAAEARIDKARLDLKTAPVRSAIQAALFRLELEEATAAYKALLADGKHLEAAEAADIELATLAFQEAQVEERRAEANAEKLFAKAPVDGLVVVSDIFRGSEFGPIQPGDQLRPRQPYMQIVDPGSIIVQAAANQVDVENLRIGALAHVRMDAYPDVELPARVYSIAPLAKSRRWRTSYVSEVQVFLKLDRVDPRLIPDLSVSADVVIDREHSDGIIPLEAVFRKGEDGESFTYVRTPSGWEEREIELGLDDNIDVAVRSGLNPGDLVALNNPAA